MRSLSTSISRIHWVCLHFDVNVKVYNDMILVVDLWVKC
jgi:hypothetical protein